MAVTLSKSQTGASVKHSTPRPTKADQKRFEALLKAGCLACLQRVQLFRVPEIHHLLSGNKRRGHRFSVPLCSYHHRNVPIGPMSLKEHRELLGPSLAKESKAFREEFGSDDELLERANRIIARRVA